MAASFDLTADSHPDEMRVKEILQRILDNVTVDRDGCYIWNGSDSGNGRGGGYGRIKINGGTMAVHRVVYTCLFGPIPPRKQIDHKCKKRLCCNPRCLVMVTPKANCKRRDGKI